MSALPFDVVLEIAKYDPNLLYMLNKDYMREWLIRKYKECRLSNLNFLLKSKLPFYPYYDYIKVLLVGKDIEDFREMAIFPFYRLINCKRIFLCRFSPSRYDADLEQIEIVEQSIVRLKKIRAEMPWLETIPFYGDPFVSTDEILDIFKGSNLTHLKLDNTVKNNLHLINTMPVLTSLTVTKVDILFKPLHLSNITKLHVSGYHRTSPLGTYITSGSMKLMFPNLKELRLPHADGFYDEIWPDVYDQIPPGVDYLTIRCYSTFPFVRSSNIKRERMVFEISEVGSIVEIENAMRILKADATKWAILIGAFLIITNMNSNTELFLSWEFNGWSKFIEERQFEDLRFFMFESKNLNMNQKYM